MDGTVVFLAKGNWVQPYSQRYQLGDLIQITIRIFCDSKQNNIYG